MKISEAIAITGGLGNPSKMPGRAYGLPAHRCKLGSVLHQAKGTVCSNCYALKGRYSFPNVLSAQERRFASLDDPRWIEAMTTLIKRQSWFRWHDSGDLQSPRHLLNIIEVCKNTPATKHWLPTREASMVRKYLDDFKFVPANLAIRISATKVNGPAASGWPLTSGVTTQWDADNPAHCPAPKQANSCGSCRKCWDTSVSHVSYKEH